MTKYSIYHIPTIKIGCSNEVENRVKGQGYTEYEILEEHECIYTASNREIELQKEYGYKVDRIPYWKSLQHFNNARKNIDYVALGKMQGKRNVESGKLKSICSLGGKVGGRKNVESGHMDRMREKSNFNKKSIQVFNKITNELVGVYESLTSCATDLGLSVSKISTQLSGKRKYHKGYYFKWN